MPEILAFGIGQISCGKYLDLGENEQFERAFSLWAQGFFTAFNFIGYSKNIEMSSDDLSAALEKVQQSCENSEHPSSVFVGTIMYEFVKDKILEQSEDLSENLKP